MSTTTEPPEDLPPPPSHFARRADRGDERWIEDWITAHLGLALDDNQRRVCRSVATNPKTAVVGANGTGKTYITGAIVLAWQNVRYPAISLGTSGTGKKLYRTLCRPIDKLQGQAYDGAGLPGTFKQQPPRIDYDDPEHYFEAATPSDAGELEGAHEAYTLALIEECDKDDVTDETVDAMRSLIPDYESGRILAVGNPPKDEANVFADLIADDSTWNTVRITSFDTHNVHVQTGAADGDLIDGMATVSALEEDWHDYHDEPWPGVDQARAWSDPDHPDFREDLADRWYRRRAGIIPPAGAGVHRPLSPDLVDAQYQPDADPARMTPESIGIDVARSGDDTVAIGPHGDVLVVHYDQQGTDHTEQEADLAGKIRDWPSLPIAVDAVGEGSGLADGLNQRFGDVHRFKNSVEATDGQTYDRCWGESLALFADYLEAGGIIRDRDLYEQAKIAARTVTWEEKELSRGPDGAKVLSATPKDEVKERLGRSPDHLDAALMSIWVRDTDSQNNRSQIAVL